MKFTMTPLDKIILHKRYIKERNSCAQIAKEFNVNPTTIHRKLIKYKIPTRTISEANLGRMVWNKGKIGLYTPSEETRKKMSISSQNSENNGRFKKGHKTEHSKEVIEKIVQKTKGHKYNGKPCSKCGNIHKNMTADNNTSSSWEVRKKISDKLKGANNGAWKGGITPQIELIRDSLEYKQWRINVFKRDHYSCQMRGTHKMLQAHHMQVFSKYPESRFNIDNGQILCEKCHKVIHTKNGDKIESSFYSY
ncbi:MAG: hypothetical protein KJ697_05000 [Nanoarchaeota archaeon]|nr:hypothetical protein [Nanoarchaeota archaeon]MBU4124297.1 hypothetical protein [Nanoarchaeota archaeon]